MRWSSRTAIILNSVDRWLLGPTHCGRQRYHTSNNRGKGRNRFRSYFRSTISRFIFIKWAPVFACSIVFVLSLSYRNHYDVKILWTSFWRSLISRCKLAFRRMCTATYWWRKYVTYCVMRMTGSHSNDFIVLSVLKVSVFRGNDMVRHFRHQYVAVHIRRVTWCYVSSLVSFSSRHLVPRSESFAFRRWTSSNGIHDPSNYLE